LIDLDIRHRLILLQRVATRDAPSSLIALFSRKMSVTDVFTFARVSQRRCAFIAYRIVREKDAFHKAYKFDASANANAPSSPIASALTPRPIIDNRNMLVTDVCACSASAVRRAPSAPIALLR
jgi:hypothetical protein